LPSVNITPTAETGGLTYANATPLTGTEADLNGGTGAITGPIPTEAGQALVAVVTLTINGHITGNNSYVVMQTDLGDGTWADLNWAVWTGSDGSTTFVFSNGAAGANTFQQTRQAGGFPTSNGSNQLCLGGRMRFVGKATAVGGSSSLAGTTAGITVTVKYKLLHLR